MKSRETANIRLRKITQGNKNNMEGILRAGVKRLSKKNALDLVEN